MRGDIEEACVLLLSGSKASPMLARSEIRQVAASNPAENATVQQPLGNVEEARILCGSKLKFICQMEPTQRRSTNFISILLQ